MRDALAVRPPTDGALNEDHLRGVDLSAARLRYGNGGCLTTGGSSEKRHLRSGLVRLRIGP